MYLAVVTATRAEYGLLAPLLRELRKDRFFRTELVVTGTHLSEKFGMTVNEIIADRMSIDEKLFLPCEDSSENGVNLFVAEGIKSFSELFGRKRYEAVIVLGDRTELFSVCIPALVYRIPIIHIHGGEITQGATDDSVRHAITKLSSLHFASAEQYRRRIIQLGEHPEAVFNVGALGIDNAANVALISEEETKRRLEVSGEFALVTFHPVTTDGPDDIKRQAETLIAFLLQISETSVITVPNADVGASIIFDAISTACRRYPQKLLLRKNLGYNLYLNAMRYASCMIGNSSSGVIESSYFGLPVINIGDRQKGRIRPENVLDCECGQEALSKTYETIKSEAFRAIAKTAAPPFGNGDAARAIADILKTTDFSRKEIIKKQFYDMF